MNDLTALAIIIRGLRARLSAARHDRDRGYSTEAVVVTALLAAAALAVIGAIVAKVTDKAASISLG
jgi:hypothetical protein